MKASLLYRLTSVLLILFALGHTLGFRRVDPRWGVDSIIGALRSTHFDVQGLNRTYWDFFSAFGFFFTVFLLFAAVLAWQLGGLPAETSTLKAALVKGEYALEKTSNNPHQRIASRGLRQQQYNIAVATCRGRTARKGRSSYSDIT